MAHDDSVLIVDDDPQSAPLPQAQDGGLSRARAGAGKKTCCKHGTGPFELLMLDIDAPASSGTDTIRLIRERSPVSVVAPSARADEDAMVENLLLPSPYPQSYRGSSVHMGYGNNHWLS